MAQESAHPLLSLPDDEIIQKLREMSLEEILKFSLISERCKDLVKSIQTESISISVTISGSIDVYIVTDSNYMKLNFYTEADMYWRMGSYGRKKKLTAPQSVQIIVRDSIGRISTRSTWEKNEMTMQNWLIHLKDIFNYPKIDQIHFADNSSQFDIDDIKEVFGTATCVIIKDTGCYTFNQMILELFPVEILKIEPSNFQNFKIPKRILMQNFDYLDIDHGGEEATSMSLDELLLINSKVITLYNIGISPKQLNKFFKLWQKGSNPHLEHLLIDSMNFTEDDLNIIMEGIYVEETPDDQTRVFKSVGLDDPDVINGGYDFYRTDGVEATIQFNYELGQIRVEMYVWFDHCIVEY